MPDSVPLHVSEIQAIESVPRVLETVAALTGMRFVCIAHVTPECWMACAVHDRLGLGVRPGATIDLDLTLCQEVLESRQPVVIDCVRDSACYRDHPSPRAFGYQSYFSIPIFRPDGVYFGTLCGLDDEPARLSDGPLVPAITLFAELISGQLETERSLRDAERSLFTERETAELREQFIAVLGHDLRTPLSAILGRVDLLARRNDDPVTGQALGRIRRSALRIDALVDDLVDFTRGRMGSGMALDLRPYDGVEIVLEQAIDELRGAYPQARVHGEIMPGLRLRCDPRRLAQMLSNLVRNALTHGDPTRPIEVRAEIADGLFVLAVSNHGPHLDAATVKQLFKPYWRAVSRVGDDGLGLGLYIVDQIARAHGGAIGVQSSQERTTFTFSMPAA
jgi:hypothetical protein